MHLILEMHPPAEPAQNAKDPLGTSGERRIAIFKHCLKTNSFQKRLSNYF
jgi:hypothetical protein